ncbi:MAG: aminotransferase class V-fold PLP-dependent enzyme [Firmicutes bacterium]|nr:aminotransferase class V-fold PLP-dependent enzyme [Bacillota bacterium]
MYFNEESPYRHLIVGANTKVPLKNGNYSKYINFDNAATTPPFRSVISDINAFSPWYSSIHRGMGFKSKFSSNFYDYSRYEVLNFVNADLEKDTVIYLKNTTEAINKLSNRLSIKDSDNIILSTSMEHHSNDLPWRKYKIDYIELDEYGRLLLTDLKEKLDFYKDNVRLVTITGASNVTGYKNKIHEIASLVHSYKSKLLVDGAQLIPHCPFNMKPKNISEHIDYLVFSSHKMYAPFGIGVLIGPIETFKKGSPDYVGGGTVDLVTKDSVIWDDPPQKDEAGTPNIMGVVALVSAIKTLKQVGMINIENYEKKLTDYTLEKLKKLPDIKLYCDTSKAQNRVSIIPFNIEGIHHAQVAKELSEEYAIALRNGCFCAQPYIQKLLKVSKDDIYEYKDTFIKRPGMVRISFGMYNDIKEINFLIDSLKKIINNKNN